MENSQQSGVSGGVEGRDLSEDGRWMTYREIAQARGIDVSSAVKLARRQRWRRQAGNRNTVRVFVPVDWLSGDREPETKDATRDNALDPADIARYLATFEATFEVLRGAHAGEIAALQAVIQEKGATIDDLRVALDTVRAEAKTAQDAAEAFRQVEAARKGRGLVGRLRSAWRGE